MIPLEALGAAELFAGLSDEERQVVAAIGRRREAAAGQMLFRAGDPAEEVFVVVRGRVELTFPLVVKGETKETRFQSLEPGRTLAWSALVPPHRLTLSARGSTEVELLAFERERLIRIFEQHPAIGYRVMSNLSRVVATRLHEMIQLWVGELQRGVSQTYR